MNLNEAIRQAALAIETDKDNDLQPSYRWAVLHALSSDRHRLGEKPIGHLRLLTAEVTAAKLVLGEWENWRPGDRSPQRMIDAAQSYLSPRWDLQAAEEIYRDNPENPVDDPIYFAHPAASRAILLAIQSWYDPNALLPEVYLGCRSNRELDFPMGWDSCFCASVVFARGVTWYGKSNRTRRQEYWRWWLSDCIPGAYNAFRP